MPSRAHYFEQLNQSLKRSGVYQPTLILDLDRLDQNIETLRGHLPDGMGYRVVAKSLPVPKLLNYICSATGTRKVMTFNFPMLLSIAKDMSDAEQLLGKPLPVAALRDFLNQAGTAAAERVDWLIDTAERLAEYANVAETSEFSLNIVLELDVGLHRGGFEVDGDLKAALIHLRECRSLNFNGFMGYEPHLASVPKIFGWQDRAIIRAWGKYEDALGLAREIFDAADISGLIRNAAGSPTYRLYKDTKIANEISVGSALVKPTDFDTALLDPFIPACFIAAPVLKAPGATRLPALEFADGLKRIVSPSTAKAFFVHGGKWMANPVDPPNLSYNKTFGRSSNQEMVNGPANTPLTPGDFIFLRPNQSEAVLLQFGDIHVARGGELIERWSTFDISA